MNKSTLFLRRVASLAILIVLLFSSVLTAQKNDDKDKSSDKDANKSFSSFIRIHKNLKGKPAGLETSVTRYEGVNKKGEKIFVDLIGVVHIGEKDYYEKLNEIFEKYDALLYELVAPKGTKIPKGGGREGGLNPVAALQQGMQSILELEFQLKHIDYTKENFVHADMSPEEFLESMEKNEESFAKMALRAIGQSMAMQNSSQMSDVDLIMAMFSDNRSYKMRQIMAKQMNDMEAGMVMFNGKDGSTIIDHRNKKAFSILEKEIASGKTKLGVFYGAGHLPNMEERLFRDFGLQRAGQFWLEAWKLSADSKRK
ncbi:hypothetical protein N9242_06250 [Vicingaceae bacterium]|nr:hypothetical protein [Vicingaceae bacterium]